MNIRMLTAVLAIAVLPLLPFGGASAPSYAQTPGPSPEASSGPEKMAGCMGMKGGMGMGGGKMMGAMHGGGGHGREGRVRGAGRHGHPPSGPGGSGPERMRKLHRWTYCLMAHREPLGLTAEQLDRIDGTVAEHRKAAIRGRAEIRALGIDLERVLRHLPPDLDQAERLLRSISDRKFELQMEGVRSYARVLDILDPGQRERAMEICRSPFPPPWAVPGPDEPEAQESEAQAPDAAHEAPGGHGAHGTGGD